MAFNISTNPKTVTSWDTINSPQAYAYKPSASVAINNENNNINNINENNNTKPKKSNKTLITIAGIAVVATGLALARKNVKALKEINVEAGETYTGIKKFNYYIAKTGQFILDTVGKLKFWGKEASKK